MLPGRLAAAPLVILLGAQAANAADLAQSPTPVYAAPVGSFLSGWEFRAGGFVSTWGPEEGDANINAEIVTPKPFHVDGWADYLIPHLQVGGTGNLAGGTNYIYAGPMWTVSYDKIFADFALGGAIHDGQIQGHDGDLHRNKLGCRALYHVSWDLGYQLTENWSVMATFDHISNGSGTLSNCGSNQGISILGARIGYRF
ncbi:MAG: acyloxyacyl hydrolase [Hyphomicrobiales bacterium]|nr:acyloxyacyl hydrolase [Hyphomicrobiales bacterium]